MKWDWILAKPAEKDLEKLDKRIRQNVFDALDLLILEIAEHGRAISSNVVKLSGRDQEFRLRVGDYRARFKMETDRLIILVIRVRHRREVYRD